jgi:hypothetical protein
MFTRNTTIICFLVMAISVLSALSFVAYAGSATDYDCIVYKCRIDYPCPIPDDRWEEDEYICENGGLICQDYPVPGLPAECPPYRVCFFNTKGFYRTTYRCTTSHSGEWPRCTPRTVSHELTFLKHGESTGKLTEVIEEAQLGGIGQRRGIICVTGDATLSLFLCPVPDWFRDQIQEKIDEWVDTGMVETDSCWFECTEDGCVKHSYNECKDL